MQRRSFLLAALAAPAWAVVQLTPTARAQPNTTPAATPARTGPEIVAPDARQTVFARWLAAPRHAVLRSRDPTVRPWLHALRLGQRVSFVYHGGLAPDDDREITPGSLYTVEGFPGTYVSGYCHRRGRERTFLLERMTSVRSTATVDMLHPDHPGFA